MAVYMEEEEAWKCPKHPSKRRRSGICPTCLRDRLSNLCPDCHHARPCACADSSSSSSSSSNPTDAEPSFRRSRSVAVPFLRSRNASQTPNSGLRTPSFMSVFKRNNTKRRQPPPEKTEEIVSDGGSGGGGNSNIDIHVKDENCDSRERIQDFANMITRSRSVGTGRPSAMASGLYRRADVAPSPAKRKFWHFPSPMRVFRSSKPPKIVVQDQSPLQSC